MPRPLRDEVKYFRKVLPTSVRVISQDELMSGKLKDYLNRHVEIDICLSRNFEYKFLVSSLNEHYKKVAQMMFGNIDIEEIKTHA